MNHWHECRICKEYFECSCNASDRLAVCCQDCAQMVRHKLLVDSVMKVLLRMPESNN